jgi:hypothetical protein
MRVGARSSPCPEQPQQCVIENERKLKADGDAEHQEEREVRWSDELPEKCREDTEQRRCAQHEADEGLEDDEQEQRGQVDALPKEPEDAPENAPDEVTGGRCFRLNRRDEIRGAHVRKSPPPSTHFRTEILARFSVRKRPRFRKLLKYLALPTGFEPVLQP